MEKIKDLYGCEPMHPAEDALARWHNLVIEKTIDELDALDVARCIRQEMFLDTAVESLIGHLLRNPLAGGQYEGELMELAGEMEDERMFRYVNEIRGIIISADDILYSRDWDSKDDRDTFFRSSVNLRRLVDTDYLLEMLTTTYDLRAKRQIARCLGEMHCQRAVEPLMEMVFEPGLESGRGVMLYALGNLNISFDQLMKILPLTSDESLEVRVSAANLIKANLERLSEAEMIQVSDYLNDMLE